MDARLAVPRKSDLRLRESSQGIEFFLPDEAKIDISAPGLYLVLSPDFTIVAPQLKESQPTREVFVHIEDGLTAIGDPRLLRIVSRHGGRIWAESAPGQGAAFYFVLGRSEDGRTLSGR